MNRGDIDGSSFSFATIRDEWSDGPDAQGIHTRTLHDGHVFEMGPVSWPAYKGARAAYRCAAPTPTPIVYPTPDQVRLLNLLRLAELA
jgi:phage head maturation protease